LIGPRDKFSLVFAAENSIVLMQDKPDLASFKGFFDGTIVKSVQTLSLREDESGQRLVFAMDFPSQEVQIASAGGAVIRGSGRISEAFLRQYHTILHGTDLSFGDRLAAVAYDLARAAEIVDDPIV
jgi:hypothetical protein